MLDTKKLKKEGKMSDVKINTNKKTGDFAIGFNDGKSARIVSTAPKEGFDLKSAWTAIKNMPTVMMDLLTNRFTATNKEGKVTAERDMNRDERHQCATALFKGGIHLGSSFMKKTMAIGMLALALSPFALQAKANVVEVAPIEGASAGRAAINSAHAHAVSNPYENVFAQVGDNDFNMYVNCSANGLEEGIEFMSEYCDPNNIFHMTESNGSVTIGGRMTSAAVEVMKGAQEEYTVYADAKAGQEEKSVTSVDLQKEKAGEHVLQMPTGTVAPGSGYWDKSGAFKEFSPAEKTTLNDTYAKAQKYFVDCYANELLTGKVAENSPVNEYRNSYGTAGNWAKDYATREASKVAETIVANNLKGGNVKTADVRGSR